MSCNRIKAKSKDNNNNKAKHTLPNAEVDNTVTIARKRRDVYGNGNFNARAAI